MDAAFSGKQPLEVAMSEYERLRNEEASALYEFTFQLASFEPPPPEMEQLLGALAGNRPQMDRFFGMYAGTLPVQEFFAPESIGEIMAGSQQGAV